jgi:rhodanese-related sulfurtransferase
VLALLFMPDYKERVMNEVSQPEYLKTFQVKEMTPDELAFRIIDHDPKLTIIDVRPQAEFSKMLLPGSTNIELKQLFQKEYSELLGNRHKRKVIVAGTENEARIAAAMAERLGYENFSVLCGGLPNLLQTVIEQKTGPTDNPCTFTGTTHAMDIRQAKDTERFRSKAGVILAGMIQEAKNSNVKPVKLVKKVSGGC